VLLEKQVLDWVFWVSSVASRHFELFLKLTLHLAGVVKGAPQAPHSGSYWRGVGSPKAGATAKGIADHDLLSKGEVLCQAECPQKYSFPGK
jgi:hypothetical protein